MLLFYTEVGVWNTKKFERGNSVLVYKNADKKAERNGSVSFLIKEENIVNMIGDIGLIPNPYCQYSSESDNHNTGVYFSHKEYGLVVGDTRYAATDVYGISIDMSGCILHNIEGGDIYDSYITNKDASFIIGTKPDSSVTITLYNSKRDEVITRVYSRTEMIETTKVAENKLYKRFKLTNYRPLRLTHYMWAFNDDKEVLGEMLSNSKAHHEVIYGKYEVNTKSLAKKLFRDKIKAITIFVPACMEDDERYKKFIDSIKTYLKVVFVAVYDEETGKVTIKRVVVK